MKKMIEELEGKMCKLEGEIRAAKEAGHQALELVLRQEMAGMRHEMAEMRREKNILLERSLQAERGVHLAFEEGSPGWYPTDKSSFLSSITDRLATFQSNVKGELTAVKGELTAVKGELKGELTAVKGELKGEFGRVEAMLSDRLSATRHASSINRVDLELALTALKLRVIPAQDSPDLSTLMGQEPDEDTPAFW
jgi:hypothetical protein